MCVVCPVNHCGKYVNRMLEDEHCGSGRVVLLYPRVVTPVESDYGQAYCEGVRAGMFVAVEW